MKTALKEQSLKINYPQMFSLKDKKVVITGGAGLIGREVVRAAAQAGADVVIADIDHTKATTVSEELNNDSLKAKFLAFDITDIKNLEANIAEMVRRMGGIDVWVNSAYPRTKDFGGAVEDVTVESWQKNIDMHLNAYALSSKYVAEHMKTKGGSIINFGSIYGVVSNDPGIYENTDIKMSMGYTAIKGGIVNLSRFLAAYFGKYNIRVNTICPGGVFDNQNATFVKNYSKRVPLKRMAAAGDIAPAVVFLASDASSYITGTTMMVDGGWTAI